MNVFSKHVRRRLSVAGVKKNCRSKVVPACMQMSKVTKQVTMKHEVFTAPLFTADNSPCNRIKWISGRLKMCKNIITV